MSDSQIAESVFKLLYRLGIDNALITGWGFSKNNIEQTITDLDEVIRYKEVLNDRNKEMD